MEKSMRDYILEEIDKHVNNTLQLDENGFMNDVLKSFTDSKTPCHYVMVIPADMGEYYTSDELNKFEMRGYYQMPVDNRFNNRFFIPPQNMNKVIDMLKNEHMTVEGVRYQNLPVEIAVVTINGMYQSNFKYDFDNENGFKDI